MATNTTTPVSPAYQRTDADMAEAVSRLNVATRGNGAYLATVADRFLADGGTGQKAWLADQGLTLSQAFLSQMVTTTRIIADNVRKADRKSKRAYDDLFGAVIAVKMSTLEGRKSALGILTEAATVALVKSAQENRKAGETLADALIRVEGETFEARKAKATKAEGKRKARPNDGTKGKGKAEGKGDKGDTITLTDRAKALSRALAKASPAEIEKASTALADLTATLVSMSQAD